MLNGISLFIAFVSSCVSAAYNFFDFVRYQTFECGFRLSKEIWLGSDLVFHS